MRVAAQRLIDASGKLDAADRALLSLLVNHGMDGDALARALHLDHARVAERRRELAEHLGAVLELPAAFVSEQLDELAQSARSQQPATTSVDRTPETSAGAGAVIGASAPDTTPPADPKTRQRRRGWLLAAVLLAAIAAVLIVSLTSAGASKPGASKPTAATTGTSPRTTPSVTSTSATTPTTTSTTTPATTSTTTPATTSTTTPATTSTTTPTATPPSTPSGGIPPSPPVRERAELETLPGGPAGMSGSIGLAGAAAKPRLVITVSGLPPAGTGHYEVWLYNSVIDSRGIARLGATGGTATVPLPRDFRRFRWIDVSMQPAGTTVHSGISMVRAAVPHRRVRRRGRVKRRP